MPHHDDDCDGETDEGFGIGEDCEVGRGACLRRGQLVCSPDLTETVCSAEPGWREDERCGNDVDDDCDGETDEMLTDPQALSACQPVGECETAHLECDPADSGGTLCVQDGAEQDVCNGKDDDCDGGVDEDFPDLGGECTAGLGICEESGGRVCAADGSRTVCSVDGGDAQEERCNGLDDDCDGTTDEMLTDPVRVAACQPLGECVFSHVECDPDDALGTICVQEGPGLEACNGLDDDCDGMDDILEAELVHGEWVPLWRWTDPQTGEIRGLGESCTVGLGICAAQGSVVCSDDGQDTECPAEPRRPCAPFFDPCPEFCDSGVDEDCDGDIDEADCTPCPEPMGCSF